MHQIKLKMINAYEVAKYYLLKLFDFSVKSLPYFMTKLKLDCKINFSEIGACLNVIKNSFYKFLQTRSSF